MADTFILREEYGRSEVDRKTPGAADARRVREPIVSKYLAEQGLKFEYPDDKKFAVCLTHDVDDIYLPLSHAAMAAAFHAKNLDGRGLRKDVRLQRDENSPYRNFGKIMKIEEEYGAVSSFYFMATDRDPKRFRYDIEDMGNELGEIADRGWEVGLHGSYYAYNDPVEVRNEKSRLEKVLGKSVIGYRNHYLRLNVPHTWQILSDAGFLYDTTLGYSNIIGFRNGMCHPFRPYDLESGRQMDILEIPTAVMDCALFEQVRSLEDAWDLAKGAVDATERYGGVINLLWHNDTFSAPFRDRWVKVYDRLLKYGREKNAWITSGENIFRWWQKNGR